MITRSSSVGAVCLRCRLSLLRRCAPVRRFATEERPDDRFDHDEGADETSQKRSSGVRFPNSKRHLSGNRLLGESSRSLGSRMLGKPAYAIVMKDEGNVKRRRTNIIYEETDRGLFSQDIDGDIEAILEKNREPATVDEVRANIHDLQPPEKMMLERDFRKLQDALVNGFLNAQLQDYMEWHATADAAATESAKGTEDQQGQEDPDAPLPEFPWIREMTPWEPLAVEESIGDKLNLGFHGYVLSNMTTKEKLAIRLMRECWGLEIHELESNLGEVTIQLRRFEFILLMRGTQRFVASLGRITLDPGEKIEAVRRKHTLRLVTTKSHSHSIIHGIDDILKRVKTKTFPLNLVGAENVDDNALEELGSITNTFIRRSHTLRRLHVTWIEAQSRTTEKGNAGVAELEDLNDIVFRLLLTSCTDKATSTLTAPPTTADSGRLVRNMVNKEKFTWRDRLVQWARFVLPQTTQEDGRRETDLPLLDFKLPFEPSVPEDRGANAKGRRVLPPIAYTKYPQQNVTWPGELATRTTASFGHILHSHDTETAARISLSDVTSSTDRRIFTPAAGHPFHLSVDDAFRDSDIVPTLSKVVMRFWPSPSPKASEPAPPAPVLELHLQTNERGITGIESFRAIKQTHYTDVMLPQSSVDVRFKQEQYEEIRALRFKHLARWQPLADFLNASRLDLSEGKIEVPPRQKFPIPRRLFSGDYNPPPPPKSKQPPSSASDQDTTKPSIENTQSENANPAGQEGSESSPEDTHNDLGSLERWAAEAAKDEETTKSERWHPTFQNPDDLQSVTYSYVGLEFQRSAVQTYEGHHMIYTSIEGGHGGGRRTEITLEPLRKPSGGEDETGAQMTLQEDFIACCSRLAANQPIWAGRHSERFTSY